MKKKIKKLEIINLQSILDFIQEATVEDMASIVIAMHYYHNNLCVFNAEDEIIFDIESISINGKSIQLNCAGNAEVLEKMLKKKTGKK